MLEVIGYSFILLIALAMTFAWPLTELARGMASNPGAHKSSRGGCIISIIGLALLAWWIYDVLIK